MTMDPPFEALNAYPLLTQDSIRLWERMVAEFVDSEPAVTRAEEELNVARYVGEAVAACTAADTDFRAEVEGLMRFETRNFQQFFIGFPDLQSVADWHEAQARHADDVIARLRALAVPEEIADSVDRFLVLAKEETDLNRQVASAAKAGDQATVDALTGQRIDATHAKDGIAFSIGYALWTCPVSNAGA